MLSRRLLTSIVAGLWILVTGSLPAAGQIPAATPAVDRLKAHEAWATMIEESRFSGVELRSVGPAVMSGRIVDIDVSPHDPTHFYVAYASGGLWKTTSNGSAFTPVFDGQPVITIGDIEVVWAEPEIVYVGTGENNSSRSSYSGTGIYVTRDGAETWSHLGLAETHHIGRIVVDPSDPAIVYVAAIGHLYSNNPERGVFKSTDAGATWNHVLTIDDSTGVIDLVIDPQRSNILYAAAWHRQRRAWNFVEGGSTSGIYKSMDAGESWELITTDGSGFPVGPGVGRIGLAVIPNGPDTVFAVVDNQDIREVRDDDLPALTFEQLESMGADDFEERVLIDDLEEYLEHHGFPDRYSADTVKAMIRRGEVNPSALVAYLGDANRALFDSPVIGCEVYRSNDGGGTWARTHDDPLDDMCYTYGYYFGQISVAPWDSGELYIAGVPLLKSKDAGRSWENVGRENVHADHHAMWMNPSRPHHIINGNDGGLNISYDGGETWLKLNSPNVGQFYTVNVDDGDPYNVYGGLQDNGVWVGPSNYESSLGWHSSGRYPYQVLLGGDGMMVEVDPRDPDIVYAGYQFGYYFRLDRGDESRESIRPEHDLGDEPFRFNWLTPIHLSKHNPDILYLGSNVVHRSMDRGDNWRVISEDLTGGKVDGDVPFGTITALTESPLHFGLLYAGSDDGRVHRSQNGGSTWDRIDTALPRNLWVSRIVASGHDDSRVYVALNGYRWDHMDPYLFVSEDRGDTWEKLGVNLPLGPVNVVREDPSNEDILYVGTDRGTFVSLDRGLTFEPLGSGSPAAPVHDLRVQDAASDLVIGTHGRSISIADLSQIRALTPEIMAQDVHVFPIDSVAFNEDWGDRSNAWRDAPEPEIQVAFLASSGGPGMIRLLDPDDGVLREIELESRRGLNFFDFDGARCEECATEDDEDVEATDTGKLYLRPGSYSIEIQVSGSRASVPLVIFDKED